MKISEQIKLARDTLEIKIPCTKSLYKTIDSYERKKRWIHRKMMKEIRIHVEKQMGIKILDEDQNGLGKTN